MYFPGEWAKAPYSKPVDQRDVPAQQVMVNTTIICGDCDLPAHLHPFVGKKCYRDPFDWTINSGDYQEFDSDPMVTTSFIIARNQYLSTVKIGGTYVYCYVDETGPTPIPYYRDSQPKQALTTSSNADYTLDDLPAVDYSGPGIRKRDSLILDDYDVNTDLDSWTDNAPPTWVPPIKHPVTGKVLKSGYWAGGEFTHATQYHYYDSAGNKVSGNYPSTSYQAKGSLPLTTEDTEKRTVFVENNDGFFSERILDLGVTERFANRLLNMYVHKKTGKFHCGSVSIEQVNDSIVATCISPLCYGKQANGDYARNTLSIPLDSTRDAMEEFTYAIIAHGNNHGPDFIKYIQYRDEKGKYQFLLDENNQRIPDPDYYELYPVLPEPIDQALSHDEIIWEHARYCDQPTCKCSDLLFPNTTPAEFTERTAA